MTDATRLKELRAMALRLAGATPDGLARAKLRDLADDLAAQSDALEASEREPKDEPPLAAT